MTTLKGLEDVLEELSPSASGRKLSDSCAVDSATGAVDGAVPAASASRCLVTLFSPTRTCDPMDGTGTFGSSFEESLLDRFLFLPLEGCTCILRCSPSGASRLPKLVSFSAKRQEAPNSSFAAPKISGLTYLHVSSVMTSSSSCEMDGL